MKTVKAGFRNLRDGLNTSLYCDILLSKAKLFVKWYMYVRTHCAYRSNTLQSFKEIARIYAKQKKVHEAKLGWNRHKHCIAR